MSKSMEFAMHDRCYGVEKGQRRFAGRRDDCVGKYRRCQRSGGDNDVIPAGRRCGNLLAPDFDQRLAFQRCRDRCGKAVAVDRERAAGRKLVRIGCAHDQRAERPHLGVQNSDGARLRVIGAERVGANKLGELFGLMCRGRAHRPHFVQHDWHTPAGELPGGFGTGKATADDVNGNKSVSHAMKLGASSRIGNVRACGWRVVRGLL